MENIIIIGAGSAGVAAAEAARKEDEQVPILLFSEENYLPYHRIRLFQVAADPGNSDKINLHPESWYEEKKIDLHLGTKIVKISSKDKTVESESGEVYPYGKLILATGSVNNVPPIKNVEAKGIHTIWSLDDILNFEKELGQVEHVVIIGGGLLGLEAAYEINKREVQVTVLNRGDKLLKRQLDDRGSEIYKEQAESLGIEILYNADTKEFLSDDQGRVKELVLKDGRTLPAQLILISAGVKAKLNLLEDADCNITVDRQIVVDETMATTEEDIYACGDNAVVDGKWYGLWMISRNEGLIAGKNAAGGEGTYTMPAVPYTANTMELPLFSAGILEEKEGITSTIEEDPEKKTYKRYFYEGEDLVGFVLLGDTKEGFNLVKKMK